MRTIAATLASPDDRTATRLAERLGGAKSTAEDAGEPKRQPLARLALQLVLAATESPAVVAEVDVNHHWLSVRRGPDDIDVASFSLSDLYVHRLRLAGRRSIAP